MITKQDKYLRGTYPNRINRFRVERVIDKHEVYVYLNDTRIYSGTHHIGGNRSDYHNDHYSHDELPKFKCPVSFIHAIMEYINETYPDKYRFKDEYEIVDMRFQTYKL